jgi:tetratricopeptide (TPR) repeat protein
LLNEPFIPNPIRISRPLCDAVSLHGVLPLRDQWRAGCEALGAGEPQRALALFREFDHWYGAEPAVAEPDFQESRIRLWALAALEAGSLEEAVSLLERWLEENPDQERFRAFLRFQLAELHRALGRPDLAERHRQHFLDDHPELPECILIHWSRADEALARKDIRAARDFMEAVLHHPGLPPSGRALAGTAMAALELAEGNQLAALEQLNIPAEGKSGEVLDFWRALMAPSMVQQLLAEDMPESALSVTGWFDNPHNLQGRLQAFRGSIPSSRRHGIRQAIWNSRWSAQLNQLEAALEQVSASMTDTDALYALRLRALLRTEASRDAAILGRALVESPRHIGPALRAEAYKGAIEACLQLKAWKEAEAYAAAFLETYPDDPALPDILFMNARTAAARKDWPAALDQVELLISSYADHPSLRSWKLLRATWLLAAGRPADALEGLQAIRETTPAAWRPFLEFQMARCREALKELDTAERLYRSVADLQETAASLRETASTALLKLHLRQLNSKAFMKDLASYRKRWPDGMNRLLVENLAGSFQRQTGNTGRRCQSSPAWLANPIPLRNLPGHSSRQYTGNPMT